MTGKKWTGVLLVCAMICLLAACAKEDQQKDCDHEYETEVISEASYKSDGKIRKKCIYCEDEQTQTIAKLESPITVKVLDLYTYVEEKPPMVLPDGTEIPMLDDHWILFELEVTNKSAQDITSFSGTLIMTDGEYTLRLHGTFAEKIKAKGTTVLSGYGVTVSYTDMTMADNMLYGTGLENLTFEFELSEVTN